MDTLWRCEVANKHHTESSGQATPPVCRYTWYLLYSADALHNQIYTIREDSDEKGVK